MASRQGMVIAGKYRLLDVVGAGSFGEVYRAEHTGLGKIVAIKLLQVRHAQDRQLVRRFQDEARRAAALRHPGIIEVHDVGVTEDGSPYQVMDFLTGISLGQELRAFALQRKPLLVGRAVALALQVLDALTVAHAAGIVHRDIKPENLFLARDERGEQLKILDFGIAKVLQAASDPSAVPMTAVGKPLGTPFYMSPEQALDPGRVDARADVYSMGATLFEMLAGRTVVLPQEIVVVIGHVIAGDIERHPRVHCLDVPVWLDEIVARALAQRPEQRFADAAQMRAALRDGQREASRRSSVAPPVATVDEDDPTRIAGDAPTSPTNGGDARSASGETPTQLERGAGPGAGTTPRPRTRTPAQLSPTLAPAHSLRPSLFEREARARTDTVEPLPRPRTQRSSLAADPLEPSELAPGVPALPRPHTPTPTPLPTPRPMRAATPTPMATPIVPRPTPAPEPMLRRPQVVAVAALVATLATALVWWHGRGPFPIEAALVHARAGEHFLRARAALDSGQARLVLEELALARPLGETPAGLMIDARARLLLGDLDGAAQALDVALAEGLEDGDALLARAAIELSRGDPRAAAVRARSLYEQWREPEAAVIYGTALFRLGDRVRARPLLEAAAASPRGRAALVELARLERAEGNFVAAAAAFAQAVDADPRNAALRLEAALLAFDTGDVTGARAQVERLLIEVPSDLAVLAGCARLRSAAGDLDGAALCLDQAFETPGGADAALVLRERGRVLLALGDAAAARAALEAATRAAPDDAQAQLLLLDAHLADGEAGNPADVATLVEQRFAGLPAAELARGREALARGDHATAVRAFAFAATTLDTTDGATPRERADAHVWLGRAQLDARDRPAAELSFQTAAALWPPGAALARRPRRVAGVPTVTAAATGP